jgi:hypothetical protein
VLSELFCLIGLGISGPRVCAHTASERGHNTSLITPLYA